MLAQQELGLPARLHAHREVPIRVKGWITLVDTKDPRLKQIGLTRGALRHFDKQSECFLKAADRANKRDILASRRNGRELTHGDQGRLCCVFLFPQPVRIHSCLAFDAQRDAAEQHPLEVLTASGNSGHAAGGTEAMALSMAGVPATVHPKLACLMERGFVSSEESREDLRIKIVAPSRKALDYIEQLAACLD